MLHYWISDISLYIYLLYLHSHFMLKITRINQLLHFPSRDSTTGRIRNSQSFVVVVGLPPRKITSPTNLSPGESFLHASQPSSSTVSMTTRFFNHNMKKWIRQGMAQQLQRFTMEKDQQWKKYLLLCSFSVRL
jgi:hypothetical protein